MGVTANLRSVVDFYINVKSQPCSSNGALLRSPVICGCNWPAVLKSTRKHSSFDASGLRSLRAALVHQAEHTKRLVVAIDDIDQLVELDLALVEDLLAHPPGSGLVILAGMHREADSAWQRTQRDRDTLLRRIASNSARRVELTPLTREEMSLFLHAFPGTSEASARFADDLVTFTGGRPDYLIAVLRSLAHIDHAMFEHLLTGSLTLRSLPLPSNIVGTVADRLSALRGQTPELIAAIATIAPAATVARLAEVTGTPADEVDRLIHKLVDNRLVRLVGEDERPSVEPSIPIEGEVAIQSLPFEAQAKLRARAARSLESEIHRGPDTIYAYVRNVLASSLPIGSSEVSATLSAAQLLIEQSRYETARRTIERLIERDGLDFT